MTQYLPSALGEKKFDRERDSEFKIDKRMTKSSLINVLSNTIQESKKTITKLSMENLLKIRNFLKVYYPNLTINFLDDSGILNN